MKVQPTMDDDAVEDSDQEGDGLAPGEDEVYTGDEPGEFADDDQGGPQAPGSQPESPPQDRRLEQERFQALVFAATLRGASTVENATVWMEERGLAEWDGRAWELTEEGRRRGDQLIALLPSGSGRRVTVRQLGLAAAGVVAAWKLLRR